MRFVRWGTGTVSPLRPSWEYRSRGSIWSIYPTGNEFIIGEERDPEEKKARFFCVHRKTGKGLWSKLIHSEWWVGVEAVTEEIIFLHGFAAPDMPLHKGIIAVDVLTGESRWEQPELCFEALADDRVIGSVGAYGKKRYTSLAMVTGRVVEEWDNAGPVTYPENHRADAVTFPETILEIADAPDFVSNALHHHETRGPVSWLSVGPVVVVSFQPGRVPGSVGALDQKIEVIERTGGEILFRDTIDANRTTFLPDSFLFQEPMIYFVRQRRDLVALDITGMNSPTQKGST